MSRTPPAGGFTLIEMAVALAILVLVLGSLLVPLQTQVEQRKTTETQRILDQALEALLGFAAANGRLPCPASAASNGIESPVGGGTCTNAYNGFLPAVTLGLGPTDAWGYLIDGWALPQNRIRYAVTAVTNAACSPASPVHTTANGIKSCWSQITAGSAAPNLTVCSTATGIAGGNCAAGATLTASAPAVIYSLGKNAPTGGTGADEAENPNPNSADNDRVFVSHTQSAAGAPNGEFDDIVIWMSANVLYSRLISAGRLP